MPDLLLRRVERTAAIVCGAMVLVALAIARGRPGPAAAVVAGWLLIEISFRMIGSSIGAMVARADAEPRARRVLFARTVVRLVGRYALLALLAYVMIARLRLHPLGLLAGVSSVVAAVSVEAIRLLLKKHRT